MASTVVSGVLLRIDTLNNPGTKSWKNIGIADGELLAADEGPDLEKGTVKIPVLGITQAEILHHQKIASTFWWASG